MDLLWSANPARPNATCSFHKIKTAFSPRQVAKLLLRRGASPSRDREGRSPEQMAAGRSCGRDSELLALLSRAV